MKHLLIIILLFPLSSWAEDGLVQSEYNECIRNNYLSKNPELDSCDFSNLGRNVGSSFRSCNMNLMRKIDLSTANLNDITTQLAIWKESALHDLNRELNSKLYRCGYMGEIEIRLDGGRSEIYKFSPTPEICEKLSEIVAGNNEEYISASTQRQDDLRDQNLQLNKIYIKAHCNGESSSAAEASAR